MRRLAPLLLLALLASSAHAQVISAPALDPFAFPWGGVTHATRTIRTLGAGSYATLDSVPVGNSGVVRSIRIADTSEDTLSVMDMWMTLSYGNAVPAADSFPLAALFGYDNAKHKMADTLRTFSTPFWERTMSLPTTEATWGVAWSLNYPIPYTNGLVVRLYATTSAHTVWVTTLRQTQLPTCWNRNYRFHVSRTDSTLTAALTIPGSGTRKVKFTSAGVGTGTNTTVTANHIGWAVLGVAGAGPWPKEMILKTRTSNTSFTVCAADTSVIIQPNTDLTSPKLTRPEVFFRRPTGKVGFIASTIGAFAGSLSAGSRDNTFLESCPRFYTSSPNAGSDGAEPGVVGTGTEDWFGGVGYGFEGYATSGHGAAGPRAGATAADAEFLSSILTGYRVLDKEPIAYTNGCSGTWAMWNTGGTVRAIWTLVYYERL